MNMRADPFRLGSFDRPATPPIQACLVPITDTVCAVSFDEPGPARAGERPRLAAFLGGEPLTGPMISTTLPLRAGGRRHVLLIGRGAASFDGRRLDLALGARIAASIDPNWLQPPEGDGAALIEGLSELGHRRLLRMFLTTGASMFGLGEQSAFGTAASGFFEMMGVRAAEFASLCPLGDGGVIASFRVPGAAEAALVGELIALAPDRLRRVSGFRQHVEEDKRGAFLHLFLPDGTPDVAMVGLGATPILLPAASGFHRPRPIVPWLERASDGARSWALDLVAERAPIDAGAAVLMREIRHGGEQAPAATLRHLSGTDAGVLIALEVSDPHDLLAGVQIERGGDRAILPFTRDGLRSARIAAHATLRRTHWLEDPARVRLVFRSGRLTTIHEGPLGVYDGGLPAGFLPADAPALAAARLGRRPAPAARRIEEIGPLPAKPACALICAVGDNLDLVRARAAMLFAEPGARGVELVYQVADGPLAVAARAVMTEVAAVFGIGHRLVTLAPDATATERLLAALGAARAEAALVLGAEVLPAARGWLAATRRALGSGAEPRLATGALLGADGAVIRAGARRLTGLPASSLPSASLPADEIGADCLALNRGAIEMLAAFTGSYPNPGIVLAETAARLGALGAAPRAHPRIRFVRYGQAAPCDPLALAVDEAALASRQGKP